MSVGMDALHWHLVEGGGNFQKIPSQWRELEIDEQLADGQARFLALNPQDSFIVQAPAGSGKTALLTQRFLALLCTVSSPEQVVAMTFTKKAAAEMRTRIMETLALGQQPLDESASLFERNSHRLAQAALAQSEKMGWHLLENPARLRVRTIDSMNGYLVQQMPLLSRFGSPSKMSEQADALYQQAALLALKEEDYAPASQALLALQKGSFSRAIELIVEMLKKRDQWLVTLEAMQDHDRLEEGLQYLVSHFIERYWSQLYHRQEDFPQLVTMAQEAILNQAHDKYELQTLVEVPLEPTIESLPAWRVLAKWLLTGGGDVRKRVTKTEGFPPTDKDLKNRFTDILDRWRNDVEAVKALQGMAQLPDPFYSEEQREAMHHLLTVLRVAAAHLKLVFAEKGESDFIEVAMAANAALGSEEAPTDLALQLDYRIQHLLVDEFQDTSVSQSALLKKIVANWQRDEGRTLFVVGDPMQSIYRFREAEVANFLEAWGQGEGKGQSGRLGTWDLTPVSLMVNFRSSQGVVDWVNQTFQQVFPKDNQRLEGAVKFTPAVAFSTDATPAVTTHWSLNKPDHESVREMADCVKNALSSGASEVAILGRAKTHLVQVATALKAEQIPFQAVELENLAERQEVQDIQALTLALWHLGDRAAWLALLRSPLIGLDLYDLTVIAEMPATLQRKWSIWQVLQQMQPLLSAERVQKTEKCQNPQSCYHSLPDGSLEVDFAGLVSCLSEAGRQRLEAVLPILEAGLQRSEHGHLAEVVKAVWLGLLGPHTLQSEAEVENIEAYLALLASLPMAELSFERLSEALGALFARPETSAASEKVVLMTMHKSKGLEFDTVILPSLGKKSRGEQEALLNWFQYQTEAQTYLIMAPITPRKEEKPLLARFVADIDKKKSQHELARLLYVACTRAKKALHLWGDVAYSESKLEKDESPTPMAGSALEPLWPVVKTEFQALVDTVDFAEEEAETLPKVKVPRLPLAVQLARVTHPWKDTGRSANKEKLDVEAETEEATLEKTGGIENPEVLRGTEWQRLTGILVHRQLEMMSLRPEQLWTESEISARTTIYQEWLRQQGLEGKALSQALAATIKGLQQAVQHPKMQWALLQAHLEAESEKVLFSRLEEGGWQQHIVDRTLVDEAGVRWIIDYKTSIKPDAQDLATFIEEKVAVYQPQLARYGQLFQQIESRPQKWVLYFSDVDVWQEVAPVTQNLS